MADITLTITIPDADKADYLAAYSQDFDEYQGELTQAQYAIQNLTNHISSTVTQYKRNVARRAISVTPPSITIN